MKFARCLPALVGAIVIVFAAVSPLAMAQEGVRPAPERIPYKQDEAELGTLMIRAGIAMVVIVALAVGAAYALKRAGFARFQTPPGTRTLQVAETIRLDPRARLFVVQFGQTRVLLAHSQGGVTLLATERSAGTGEQKT